MKNTTLMTLVRFAILFYFAQCTTAWGQTFLDRQNADDFRIVSYNMYWDELFEDSSGRAELGRLINAVDADVYNFQEAAFTTAADAAFWFDSLAPLSGSESWQVHKGRNQLIVSRHDLAMQQTNVPNGARGIAMALVDLPDSYFANDLFLLNNHFPCCTNEAGRQVEANAISAWLRDATTVGGNFDLAPNTGISVLGDLNIVGGPTPLITLIDGTNGLAPDWDDTSLADVQPVHNATGSDDWTWRDDDSGFDPGILDYVLYTDSVLDVNHSYILNPSTMFDTDLQASGLQATDFKLDKSFGSTRFDHLPLIVDFSATDIPPVLPGDFNSDGRVDLVDLDHYGGVIGEAAAGDLAKLDLDQDGFVGANDATLHYEVLVETSNGGIGTFAGDLNLDGSVNVLGDGFGLVGNLNQPAVSWSQGDFNFDQVVNVLGDGFLLVQNLNKSNLGAATAASTQAVPEPNNVTLLIFAVGLTLLRRKNCQACRRNECGLQTLLS